ncbi:hypothetical protein PE143B_0116010 [Pseudomonas extremaustralis 14-3 substr. 14-3b]|nr:hypothetical protein PE143B_0116010 [Pseudomonas extremaustralis 14-3 substr. 14-3b]
MGDFGHVKCMVPTELHYPQLISFLIEYDAQVPTTQIAMEKSKCNLMLGQYHVIYSAEYHL